MTSSITRDFARVSKRTPCPICNRTDWCLIERESLDDPRRDICQRVESPTRWGAGGRTAECHRLCPHHQLRQVDEMGGQ